MNIKPLHIVSKALSAVLSLLLIAPVMPAAALDKVSLQLRWLHQAQFAGFYMAKEKGFYRKAGLEVTIRPGGNNKSPIKEVLNQQADFGVGNTEVLVAYGHGFPLTALAAIYQHSPSVLVAKAGGDIRTVRDLVGKRVMMFSGAEDAELIVLLSRHNIDLSDLEQITTSANISDLISGKVDAFNGYLTNEPYYLQALGEKALLFKPADDGINFYSDVIFTHAETAEQHPGLVERFTNASIEGWYYALRHIEETLEVIERRYHPQKSRAHLAFELEAAAGMIMPNLIEIGHMNPARWQSIADQLSGLNIIPDTTIDGAFLYPLRTELTWQDFKFYAQIGAFLLAITSLAAGYFLYINRQLKREVSYRIEAEQKAEEMVRKDMLTGIANRYALVEELHRTVNGIKLSQASPTLLFIDLDNFKVVNDSYGHETGDRVLQQFCFRVAALLDDERSFFARLAGDEFVILLNNTPESEAEKLVSMVIAAAGKRFTVGQDKIQIGASVGLTFYRRGDTPDYFLSRADNKMYRNKKRSRRERLETA